MSSKIFWFTGLSGSGKTTLSRLLKIYLKKRKKKVLLIDGDSFRKKIKSKNSFSKRNIIQNNLKIINFVKSKKRSYDYVIVSVISPFLKTRQIARKFFKNLYFEIHVFCKVSTLRKRDTKGLYKKADKRILKNLIGYKSKIKYEKSKYKNISIDTDKLNKQKSIKKILKLSNEF